MKMNTIVKYVIPSKDAPHKIFSTVEERVQRTDGRTYLSCGMEVKALHRLSSKEFLIVTKDNFVRVLEADGRFTYIYERLQHGQLDCEEVDKCRSIQDIDARWLVLFHQKKFMVLRKHDLKCILKLRYTEKSAHGIGDMLTSRMILTNQMDCRTLILSIQYESGSLVVSNKNSFNQCYTLVFDLKRRKYTNIILTVNNVREGRSDAKPLLRSRGSSVLDVVKSVVVEAARFFLLSHSEEEESLHFLSVCEKADDRSPLLVRDSLAVGRGVGKELVDLEVLAAAGCEGRSIVVFEKSGSFSLLRVSRRAKSIGLELLTRTANKLKSSFE